MQVSADYYGPQGIKAYFALRDAGAPVLHANVREGEDLREAAQRSYLMRTCQGCGRSFVVSRNQENRAFHSDACHAKQTEKNAAKGIIPSGWKSCAVCGGPFLPERASEKYCKRTACSRASARQSARTVSERAA